MAEVVCGVWCVRVVWFREDSRRFDPSKQGSATPWRELSVALPSLLLVAIRAPEAPAGTVSRPKDAPTDEK